MLLTTPANQIAPLVVCSTVKSQIECKGTFTATYYTLDHVLENTLTKAETLEKITVVQ